MGKPSVPDVPDYTEIMAAAQASAEMANQIAQDQLDWAKVTYEQDKAITDPIMASYQQTLDFTQATAEADRARYEEVYQPLEDQLIAEATSYASPERLELEMGRAQAGVAQSMEAARQASAQELKSYGVNPASPSYAGFDIAERTAQAATTVQAGEQAYQQTQAKADALRSEALNIGKGYPGMISSSYNTALTAGSQAVGGTNQTTQTASNAMTQPATYMNTANQSLDVWGNTINNSFNNQMAAYNAQVAQSSGVGSVLGAVTSLAMPFVGQATGLYPTYAAEGGEIMPRQSYAPGGAVPAQQSPSSGGRVDDVPAQLTAGEFVVPEDVVRWKGSEYFYKELDKARQSRMEMASPTGRPIPQPPKQQAGGQPQMGQMSGPRPQPMGHHPMPRPTPPMQGIPRYAAGGAVPAAPIRMQDGGQPYDYMTPASDPTVLQQNGAYQLPDGSWVIPPQPVAPAPPPPVQVDTSWVPMQQSTAPPAATTPGQAFAASVQPLTPPVAQQSSGRTQYPSSYPQAPPLSTPPVAYSPLAAAPLANTYRPPPLPNTYRPTSPAPPTAQAGQDVTADYRIQQAFNTAPPTDPAGRIVQAFSNLPPTSTPAPRGSPGSPQYAGSGSPGSPYRTPTYTPPFEKTPADNIATASTTQSRPSRGAQARTARKPRSRPSESKSVKGKAKTAAKKRPIIKENAPYSTSAFEFARQGQDYLNRNKPKRAKRGAVDTPLMPSARSK